MVIGYILYIPNCSNSSSAKWKIVWKPNANHPDNLVDLTGASKQFKNLLDFLWAEQNGGSKARFTPTCKARSTPTSEASFTPTSEACCTPTRLLPPKTDPLLLACFQYYQWSQLHPYQRSQIQRCRLALSEVRLSDSSEWSCQSSETTHVRVLKVSMSEMWVDRARISVVKVSISEWWERSQIRSFLSAHSESRYSATSEARSTTISLLPAKTGSPLRAEPV